jgi:hypothetical protein
VDLPARLGTSLAQRVDEALSIRIIHGDPFAPVTAIHDMINRASIPLNWRAIPGEWLWSLYVSISRTDPFISWVRNNFDSTISLIQILS